MPKRLQEKYRDVMPTGAGALFFIQMFPMLAFSVLYSTLILYTTKGLHMSDMLATSITGSFLALNYFLHLIGGFVGGRFLSNRSLFLFGMLLEILGCYLMSIPETSYLLWGLAVFLGGNGLNVTCINCMLTQLFAPNDQRREAAFLWNYASMNVGFFMGYCLGGYYDLLQNYAALFIFSALGNVIAVVLTLYSWYTLRDRETLFAALTPSKKNRARILGVTLIIALIFLLRLLLNLTAFCNAIVMFFGLFMTGYMMWVAYTDPDTAERNNICVYLIFALVTMFFWALILFAPMGLSLFIERNVDRHFMQFIITPQWILNSNMVVSILGAPLVSMLFTKLRERGININIPLQFTLALFLIGIAFILLPLGIRMADDAGYVSMQWIIASYSLQSIADLFISPIGYALVGQLAPKAMRGLLQGMWMMYGGIAALLADHYTKIALVGAASTDPLLTNPSYSQVFGDFGWCAIAAAIVLFFCTPFLNKLMNIKNAYLISQSSADLPLAKQ